MSIDVNHLSTTQAQNTQSTYSTHSTGTDNVQPGTVGLQEAHAVTPQNVHETSSFAREGVTGPQAGHRILSSPPPTPTDTVHLNANNRALANNTMARIHSIGVAFQQNYHTGLAGAIGNNPEHGMPQVARDQQNGGYYGSDGGPGVNPYGGNTGTSPFSLPANTGSTPVLVSTPSATPGSTPMSATPGSSPGSTPVSEKATSGASGSSSALQTKAEHLSKDCKHHGCAQSSHKKKVEKELRNDGFTSSQASYLYDHMRKADPKTDTSGLTLAQGIVVGEQNPSVMPQVHSSVTTLMNTQSGGSDSAFNGGKNTTKGFGDRASAINQLDGVITGAGLTVDPNAFGIGGSEPGPPTPGANGWTISPLNTQT